MTDPSTSVIIHMYGLVMCRPYIVDVQIFERNILSVKFSRDLIFEDGYLLENLNSVKICVCDL